MSEDEVVVLWIAVVVAGVSWTFWLVRLSMLRQRARPGREARRWIWASPLVASLLMLAVLLLFSAADVKNDPKYIFFYMVFAAAWVGILRLSTPAFGISVRDDALERRNVAAAIVWFGAVQAFTLCFAGGNIGDGPGWWVVVYSGGLSTGTLLLLWAVLERLTGVSERVTIDRDTAGGLRFAGWLIATSVVLGAGVAGDWQSVPQTNVDFVQRAWPASLLLVAGFAAERLSRPTPVQPAPSLMTYGVVPLTLYLVGACLWVAMIGLEP